MSQYDINSVLSAILEAKNNHKKTVLVTGVFDCLHQEHISFLKKAKAAGDYLIVGIETDKRVTKMKGNQRPKNSHNQRLDNLKSLHLADTIFILPVEFSDPKNHQRLISQIKPDILAVSSHTKHQLKKKQIIEKYGGIVKVVHQHNPQFSTTKILKTKS
jgi:rfaE bifunctional protein nucleotidyltransferase chain/domain